MNNPTEQLQTSSLDLTRAFNDYIFRDSSDQTDELNSSEEELYDIISNALETSSEIADFVPVLPKQLAAFLDEIDREDTDFDKICGIVENDISLAGETIRIANSPLYRRSDIAIESIGKAISMLGLDGVNRIATSLMMKQVLTIKSAELQHIGDTLWKHCLECAEACRTLNETEDQFSSYLMGLVHDVGAVAIFSCYAAHQQDVESEGTNHINVLKSIMEEQSNWLSAHIAKEWHLPQPIISALYDFDNINQMKVLECDTADKSALSLILEKANNCSQVYTLIKQNLIDEDEGKSELLSTGITEEKVDEVFAKFESMKG